MHGRVRQGGSTIRFDRRSSALDQLADALRRADTTWRGAEIDEWAQLSESEQQEWRDVARAAATAVYEEISV
jgi:hypothetical protein